MPLFDEKEFAQHSGVQHGYVKMYIKRGKILVNEDGLIDDKEPLNQLFVEKRKDKKEEKKQSQPKVNGNLKNRKPSNTKVIDREVVNSISDRTPKPEIRKAQSSRQKGSISEGTQLTLDLDLRTKEAEFEKKQQEIELNRLKIAKLKGDVIPTDLVKVVFGQHFKSVTTAFHQGADGFISTVAKRAGIEKAEIATLRGELIEIVNQAVKDAVQDSKSSINNIVREYSVKRGVGERT